MQALIRPLSELAEFEELYKTRKEKPGMTRVCGCVNSQKTHMMYALGDGCKYKVIACSSESKAKRVYEEYRFLDGETYLYPAKDLLFYQADLRSKELVKQRMQVLEAIISKESVTVVTTFDAFMDALLPKKVIKERVIRIAYDASIDMEELARRLSGIGYDREEVLVADRDQARRKYPKAVIDPASIDEIMLLYVKGESK